jgi:hypothetical protein
MNVPAARLLAISPSLTCSKEGASYTPTSLFDETPAFAAAALGIDTTMARRDARGAAWPQQTGRIVRRHQTTDMPRKGFGSRRVTVPMSRPALRGQGHLATSEHPLRRSDSFTPRAARREGHERRIALRAMDELA